MKPTHLDLFSGIGGFALAAQAAGFETIGFSEIDAYANAEVSDRRAHGNENTTGANVGLLH